MKVLVSGSTGLVGTALCGSLEEAGHTIVRLVRRAPSDPSREVQWDPKTGDLAPANIEGMDAIVHLAGESIANGRWNDEKKARIRDSRVQGTALLARAIAKLDRKPNVWISASAIGYYGSRGEETLTEDSAPGSGFLADVCKQWESATELAGDGLRLVNPRIGVVLGTRGGALATMLTPFKLGVGGVIGSGQQYMSWIDLDDLVGVLRHCLEEEGCRGAVNAVSPGAVTNREFTKTLGKVLSRPTIFPMPAFAARMAFGEMADALLLASTRVEPARLKETGYEFKYPELETSLRHQLGK